MLVLDFKERNDCKIYHSSTKLIASDSDIGEAFKSMHQSIVKKMKHFAGEYCIVFGEAFKSMHQSIVKKMKHFAGEYYIVLDVIIKHNIEMFDS